MNDIEDFFKTAKDYACGDTANIYCKLFLFSPDDKESQLEPVLTGTYKTLADLIEDIDSLHLESDIKDFIITNLNNNEISSILYQCPKRRISEIAGSLQLKKDDIIVELFAKYDIFY